MSCVWAQKEWWSVNSGHVPSILNAVTTLLGSFYCFNMEFLKGICGIEKKIVRAHVFGSGKRQSSSVCGKCLSKLKVKA